MFEPAENEKKSGRLRFESAKTAKPEVFERRMSRAPPIELADAEPSKAEVDDWETIITS